MKPTKLLENATTITLVLFIIRYAHTYTYIGTKYGTYERNDDVVRLSGGRIRWSCTAKCKAMCLHNQIYYINKCIIQ